MLFQRKCYLRSHRDFQDWGRLTLQGFSRLWPGQGRGCRRLAALHGGLGMQADGDDAWNVSDEPTECSRTVGGAMFTEQMQNQISATWLWELKDLGMRTSQHNSGQPRMGQSMMPGIGQGIGTAGVVRGHWLTSLGSLPQKRLKKTSGHTIRVLRW